MTIFDLELPIVQAPMASINGSAMAIAVSQAGGLGSLPCTMLPPDAMRDELHAIKAQTSKPFNANFFCHAEPEVDPELEKRWREALEPYYDELGVDQDAIPSSIPRFIFGHDAVDVMSEVEPPIVSFHFGLPSDELLGRVRRWGPRIISSATTVDEARWLDERGVDAIIAQGLEAGGHRGMFLTDDVLTQVGTLALVRQIVDAVKVPVIAAGGIADARGVAAALAAGAEAVQAGTAYLLCPEALTPPHHRAALKSDAARVTAVTNVFTGRPARGIVNRIIREVGPMHPFTPAFPLAAAAVLPLRMKAEGDGNAEFSPLFAGQNTSGCKEVGAGELTRELAEAL